MVFPIHSLSNIGVDFFFVSECFLNRLVLLCFYTFFNEIALKREKQVFLDRQ